MISRRVAGETVLVPIGSRTDDPEAKAARLFVLNETGDLLWERLGSPRTLEDLARILTAEFDASEEQARADVEQFLTAMHDISAVERVGGE